MDKYARQRGLVLQDVVGDAEVSIHGTGPALPYLLQCLALAGVGSRHGSIRLHMTDRLVIEADLAGQFLLRQEDLGVPLGAALAHRVSELDDAIDIGVPAGQARGLSLAVPTATEIGAIEASGADVSAWGQPLATSVYVGPQPLRLTADPRRTMLSAALAAVCGGLLAQAALRRLGAIVTGPAVLASWYEEHLWLAHPGIGTATQAAIDDAADDDGKYWPALRGVLERISPSMAQRFQILVDGLPAKPDPRIATIVGKDAVVVTVRRDALAAQSATVRPCRDEERAVGALLWSPVEGAVLRDGAVDGDDVWPDVTMPPASIVVCGAGALGSWATGVLAASRIPGLRISVVDMDDSIETHNLNRQVLFGGADVGQPKAQRAVDRLKEIDPGLDARALQVAVTPQLAAEIASLEPPAIFSDVLVGLGRYRESVTALSEAMRTASVVLSCPDNHQTRWSLNLLTESLGLPLIDGAITGFAGRLHVCDPGDHGQCLVCWLGTSIANDPRRESCTDLIGAEPVPAIVTSAAVIGAAQAAVLIAQLSGLSRRLRRYHAFDGTADLLSGFRGADREDDECPAHLLDPVASQQPAVRLAAEGSD